MGVEIHNFTIEKMMMMMMMMMVVVVMILTVIVTVRSISREGRSTSNCFEFRGGRDQ